MKKIITLLITLCFGATTIFTQVNLEKIKAPSSPAASVIGIQPSVLLAPKSYKSLETALFSNYFNSNGEITIPNNFGVEFTPYWANDPKLSVEEYLFPNIKESFARSATISVASTQNFLLSDTINTKAIGFGFRTTLYIIDQRNKAHALNNLDSLMDVNRIKNISINYAVEIAYQHADSIKSNKGFVKIYIDYLDHNASKLELFENKDIQNKILKDLEIKLNADLPPYSIDNIESFIEEFNIILDEFFRVKNHLEKIENFEHNKPGFKIDIAAAICLDFPTNEFEFSIAPKKSVWLTPSYSFKNKLSFLDVLGVLRYNHYDLEFYEKYFPDADYFQHNIDYGLAINCSFKKLSMQVEMAGRVSKTIIDKSTDLNDVTTTKSTQSTDFQLLGNINYRLTDNLMLTYNFGKQFDPILNYQGTLISLMSLNFALGGPTVDSIKNE